MPQRPPGMNTRSPCPRVNHSTFQLLGVRTSARSRERAWRLLPIHRDVETVANWISTTPSSISTTLLDCCQNGTVQHLREEKPLIRQGFFVAGPVGFEVLQSDHLTAVSMISANISTNSSRQNHDKSRPCRCGCGQFVGSCASNHSLVLSCVSRVSSGDLRFPGT